MTQQSYTAEEIRAILPFTRFVPRTFWWAISLCLTSLTAATIVMAWRSQNVSVKVASTEVHLTRAAANIEGAYDQLKSAQGQLESQAREIVLLRESTRKAWARVAELQGHPAPPIPTTIAATQPVITPEVEQSIKAKLSQAQQSIEAAK